MSFKKITDYSKRNDLVKEYLDLKRDLKNRYITERIGEDYRQKQIEEQSKPLTEIIQKQYEQSKNNQDKLLALTETNQRLIEQSNQRPAITFPSEDSSETSDRSSVVKVLKTSPTAAKYLLRGINKTGYDTTFGIKVSNDGFFLGDKKIDIEDDDIKIGNESFPGTEGLYELITKTNPDRNSFNQEDFNHYGEIMHMTNNLFNEKTVYKD